MSIRLLDPQVAELIAAGEVVERPASVVKELCENAIDAGASQVSVDIERGGVALIRVADNGCGIEAADLPLAFVRHATSKVRRAADLEAIETLGFRGEALASAASVARVQIFTKHDADAFASRYSAAEACPQPDARPRGTTVEVRDLFYNTPARMKFLKKDASEAAFVTETVTRMALSHPEVAFRYSREGKPVFATPGDGVLKSAVWETLGAAFARDLLELDEAEGPYRVYGLASRPAAGRASRGMQFFFVGGRFVKNRTMMAALEQAYRGMAMQGRFPGAVLFLEMPAGLVDVNVHPAKTEVRFANEQEVFHAVYRAVKAALLAAAGQYRELSLGGMAGGAAGGAEEAPASGKGNAFAATGASIAPNTSAAAPAGPPPLAGRRPGIAQLNAAGRMLARSAQAAGLLAAGSLASETGSIVYQTAREAAPAPAVDISALEEMAGGPEEAARGPRIPELSPGPAAAEAAPPPEQQSLAAGEGAPEAPALRVLGELFKTYVVAEAGEALCLIDKHAAHERLLYEKIAASRGEAGSQQLLAPVSVPLSAAEKDALLQNTESLLAAGLELEDFGGAAVLVRGVPADVPRGDIEGLVTEVAARLAANAKDSTDAKTQWVLHSMACRAAVKGGTRSRPEELLALAGAILSGEVPPFCPHGRPVVLKLTRRELEKQFGRLG